MQYFGRLLTVYATIKQQICAMWWLTLALAAISEQRCAPGIYAACQVGYRMVPYTYDDYRARDDDVSCILCSEDNCSAAQPASKAHCFPHTKSCVLCGSPSPVSLIGPDYNVVFQSKCTSARPCSGTVSVDSPITFARSNGMVVRGTNQIVAALCPAVVFTDAVNITIRSLEIYCSGAGSEAAPAIVIYGAAKLVLYAPGPFVASGYCHSALLVNGYIRTAPYDTNTDLSGSTIGNVSVAQGRFRDVVDVALAYFSGAIDVTSAPAHTRFVIIPSDTSGVLSYNANQTLSIQSASVFTNIYGRDAEVSLQDKDADGWSSTGSTAADRAIFQTKCVVVIVLALVFLYQLT